MSKSMQHWNGHQLCAIDTETTGLDASWHEMIQICILPLDSNIDIRKDIMPFYITIIPESPERADREAMAINRLDFAKIGQTGHDREKAKDLLEEWMNKLGLPYTRTGLRKKIIPLGHNYAFDRGFIQKWLGPLNYDHSFHYHYKDTMIAANYLNDRAAIHSEKIPYPKINLRYLCNQLGIKRKRVHDALSDCIDTARAWQFLINQGLLG